VDAILKDVRERGDEALFSGTRSGLITSNLTQDTIEVTEEEIREAYDLADPDLIDVIRKALVNIRSFHEKQVRQSWFTETSAGRFSDRESRRWSASAYMCRAARRFIRRRC
jgi:histidinol dehydrogenase